MTWQRVLLGVTFICIGAMLMSARAADKMLESERQFGTETQRRAVTPARRRSARRFSAVVGLAFIAGGVLTVLTDEPATA